MSHILHHCINISKYSQSSEEQPALGRRAADSEPSGTENRWEGRIWQAPTRPERHPWSLVSVQAYPVAPGNCRAVPFCVTVFSSANPRSSSRVPALEQRGRDLFHAGHMQRGGWFSMGSPRAAAGSVLQQPSRSTGPSKEFLSPESMQGAPSRAHGTCHPPAPAASQGGDCCFNP